MLVVFFYFSADKHFLNCFFFCLWFSISLTSLCVSFFHRNTQYFFVFFFRFCRFSFNSFISFHFSGWWSSLIFRVDSYHIQTTHITAFKNFNLFSGGGAAVAAVFNHIFFCSIALPLIRDTQTHTATRSLKSLDKLGFFLDLSEQLWMKMVELFVWYLLNSKCWTNCVILIEFLIRIDV